MSAIWRRAAQLRVQGVPFAEAMRQARRELDPDYDGLAHAVIESQRVEGTLRALGMDRMAIYAVQQRIADLHTTSQLTWREATDHVLDQVLRA